MPSACAAAILEEISPAGLNQALEVAALLAYRHGMRTQPLTLPGVLPRIGVYLSGAHLSSLLAWPSHSAGNRNGVATLVTKVAALLHVPFSNIAPTSNGEPPTRALLVLPCVLTKYAWYSRCSDQLCFAMPCACFLYASHVRVSRSVLSVCVSRIKQPYRYSGYI